MTTQPKPLRASPIQIEAYEFLDIEVHASEHENAHSSLGLKVNRAFSPHEEDPLSWRIELTVHFGDEQNGVPSVYTGMVRIAGYFKVNEAYPREKASQLIEITGASMLYGACREMIASLTARNSRGMVTLPSITFVEPKPPTTATLSTSRVAEEAPSYGAKKPSGKKQVKK
jgi:preprotein translocase subunit SecB